MCLGLNFLSLSRSHTHARAHTHMRKQARARTYTRACTLARAHTRRLTHTRGQTYTARTHMRKQTHALACVHTHTHAHADSRTRARRHTHTYIFSSSVYESNVEMESAVYFVISISFYEITQRRTHEDRSIDRQIRENFKSYVKDKHFYLRSSELIALMYRHFGDVSL